MAGGTIDFTLDTITATAELYDPATNTSSPAASMSTPRVGHTATLLTNGMVLVAGGSNDLSTTGSRQVPKFTIPYRRVVLGGKYVYCARGSLGDCVTSGAVLVAGGGTDGNSPVATADLRSRPEHVVLSRQYVDTSRGTHGNAPAERDGAGHRRRIYR